METVRNSSLLKRPMASNAKQVPREQIFVATKLSSTGFDEASFGYLWPPVAFALINCAERS